MLFSAYNSDGLRTLSTAHSDAMESVRQATAHQLSEADRSRISDSLAKALMKAHDAGERDLGVLKSAALQRVFASQYVQNRAVGGEASKKSRNQGKGRRHSLASESAN